MDCHCNLSRSPLWLCTYCCSAAAAARALSRPAVTGFALHILLSKRTLPQQLHNPLKSAFSQRAAQWRNGKHVWHQTQGSAVRIGRQRLFKKKSHFFHKKKAHAVTVDRAFQSHHFSINFVAYPCSFSFFNFLRLVQNFAKFSNWLKSQNIPWKLNDGSEQNREVWFWIFFSDSKAPW